MFLNFSKLLIESEVNGRPISTFKLNTPIRYKGYFIDLLELPAPKAGKDTIEGFEHIEVVSKNSFKQIIEENPMCSFSTSGLVKDFNQELALNLGTFTVKFHYLSLESVVSFEKNNFIYKRVSDSRILSVLKEFDPLIAGTFPLELNNKDSDVDLILNCNDLKLLSQILNESYGNLEDFKEDNLSVRNIPSYIANFSFESVKFEIFAQDKPSVQQRAYVHFQTQEQLLKLGGQKLKNEVLKLRNDGLKTEEAFCKALNLTGDVFNRISNLSKYKEEDLYSLVKSKL